MLAAGTVFKEGIWYLIKKAVENPNRDRFFFPRLSKMMTELTNTQNHQ